METFSLICTLSVTAYTTVEAESLEAAIEIAKDREVVVEIGDEDVEWVAREIMCETPEEIREQPKISVEVHLKVNAWAAASVRAGLSELSEPIERDYDGKDPGSFARAREAYQRRVAELQCALDRIQAETESLAGQQDATAP